MGNKVNNCTKEVIQIKYRKLKVVFSVFLEELKPEFLK